MSEWENIRESAKKYKEAFDEYDRTLTSVVLWLTGLSVGEISFLFSSRNDVRNDDWYFWCFIFLLIGISGGLLFNLTKVFYLFRQEKFWAAARNVCVIDLFLRNARAITEKERDEKINEAGKLEEYMTTISKQGCIWQISNFSALFNIVFFIFGSIFFVFVLAFNM